MDKAENITQLMPYNRGVAYIMKKILVGLGITGLFIGYSLGVRHEQMPATQAVSTSNGTSNAAPGGPSKGAGSGAAPASSASQQASPSTSQSPGQYNNGTYRGSANDAFYGTVQVEAIISSGRISGVSFLQYPDAHDDSLMINQQAMPLLKQEAIQVQNANVQIVSGATFTSQAFIQSLRAALSEAKA